MHVKLKNILPILFLGIVLVATFSLVMPTLSYIEFFRAIENLDLSVKEIEPRIEGDEIMIKLTLVLSNNAQYALKIHRVSCEILLKENGGYMRVAYPKFEFPGPPYKSLQPYSNVTMGSSELRSQNVGISPGQTVTWMIRGEVLIETFLGTIFPPLHPSIFNATVT